jgi:hypothetical protein
MSALDEVLAQRPSTHGDFAENAETSQELKHILRSRSGWHRLPPIAQEAIDLICTKLSRVVSGDGRFGDHWVDIAGYAQLVARELESDPPF